MTALLVSQQATGQSFHDAPEPLASDTVTLGFARVWNTFVWRGILGLALADSDNALTLHQTLRSKLIRTSPIASQGEYDGDVRYRRRIEGRWDLLMRTSSLVVSDNQSIDLSRLAQHDAFVGLGYGINSWKMSALGGYEVDVQQDTHDQGPVLDALLQNPMLRFQQITATFESHWTKSFLGARNPEQRYAGLSLARDFGGGGSDSLTVHYTSQRREFYTSADPTLQNLYSVTHNIFRRDEASVDVSNQLLYHMGWSSQIIVRGTLQNRTIDRSYLYKNILQPSSVTLDSRIQELLLNASVSVLSQPFDWLRGEAGMSLEERDARFAVQDQAGIPTPIFQSQEASARRLENTSRRTSMWGSIRTDVSQSDIMKLNGSASILRYDTPDSLNTDDRDELLLALSLEETHIFNEYLSAEVVANATLSHLVYLDRLQSANNNWNRVFSFSPTISFTPVSWFRSDNRAEVVANYTVYDFEEQVSSVKSFAFRQASWSDSTTIAFNDRIELNVTGTMRLYERGILKWKDFTEKPLDYFVEKSLWPEISYRTRGGLLLSVGYRYFSRDQFAYDGAAKSLTHTILTTGPTAGIEWYGPNGTNVIVSGWRETSTNDSSAPTYASNLSISVNFIF